MKGILPILDFLEIKNVPIKYKYQKWCKYQNIWDAAENEEELQLMQILLTESIYDLIQYAKDKKENRLLNHNKIYDNILGKINILQYI